jgi:C4-dicarboxylate transporter DctM subunit
MIIPAWTEETARFLFIWSTYSAIPLTIRLRNNIRVDVIYDRLSPSMQGMTWIMVDIAFLALSSVILYTSLGYLEMQLTYAQYTPALRIPYYMTPLQKVFDRIIIK